MPLTQPATTQPGLFHEAFLQYQIVPGQVQVIVFDSVTSEDWDESASVTEHPVENGANITDHVRVQLAKCTLKVRVTNEPLDSNQFVDPVGGAGQMVPLPLGIPQPKTPEFDGLVIVPTWQNNSDLSVLVGSVAGTVSEVAGRATDAVLQGTPTGNVIAAELRKAARITGDINQLWAYPEDVPQVAIGGFPVRSASDVVSSLVFEGITSLIPSGEEVDVPTQTDAGLVGGDGFSIAVVPKTTQFSTLNPRDFAADMKALLVGLKDSAQLFTVQGSKQIQANMVIETLTSHRGAPEETGTGMDMTIGLKEVRIVTSNTVAAPAPSLPRAATPINSGAQDPTPPPPAAMRSVFKAVLAGSVNVLPRGRPAWHPVSGLAIRTSNAPFDQQTTTLEGVTYLLSFTFNQRCSCWYLNVADANGVDIYNGVKLVCNFPLLRKCADPRKPAGDLFVISTTADQSPPGLQDLVAGSGRCTLYYFTSDWIALMQSGASGIAVIQAQLANNTVNQNESTYGMQ